MVQSKCCFRHMSWNCTTCYPDWKPDKKTNSKGGKNSSKPKGNDIIDLTQDSKVPIIVDLTETEQSTPVASTSGSVNPLPSLPALSDGSSKAPVVTPVPGLNPSGTKQSTVATPSTSTGSASTGRNLSSIVPVTNTLSTTLTVANQSYPASTLKMNGTGTVYPSSASTLTNGNGNYVYPASTTQLNGTRTAYPSTSSTSTNGNGNYVYPASTTQLNGTGTAYPSTSSTSANGNGNYAYQGTSGASFAYSSGPSSSSTTATNYAFSLPNGLPNSVNASGSSSFSNSNAYSTTPYGTSANNNFGAPVAVKITTSFSNQNQGISAPLNGTATAPNSGSFASVYYQYPNPPVPSASSSSIPTVAKVANSIPSMPSTAFSVNGVNIPAGTFNLISNTIIGNAANTFSTAVAASVAGPSVTRGGTRGRGRGRGGRGRGAATIPVVKPKAAPKKKRTFTDLTLTKQIRATIIDDDVAVQIFRELKMTDNFLNSGNVLAWALQPDDEAFINIHDYVARSQEHGFGVKVLSILRIIPKASDLAPLDFNEDAMAQGMYRMMLWHGTKRSFVGPILENGLKIPTSHGQMFGAGIYFADRVSKSCQYCDRGGGYGYNNNSAAYLFLCDVLLGEMYKSATALPNTTTAPKTYGWGQGPVEFNSVKGCGINVPDIEWQKEIDGCIWPLGPTVRNNEDAGPLSLNYNEYIVYNTSQVQPKYLVKVSFTRTPVYENLY